MSRNRHRATKATGQHPLSDGKKVSICREETNGAGRTINGPDGNAIVFSSMIYTPKGITKIAEGTQVLVSETDSADGVCRNQRAHSCLNTMLGSYTDGYGYKRQPSAKAGRQALLTNALDIVSQGGRLNTCSGLARNAYYMQGRYPRRSDLWIRPATFGPALGTLCLLTA